MNKLFLLDAYALIYRAYYGMMRSPRITSRGQNVSAVFGFCKTLDEVLRKEQPSHIAVCFDPAGGTFRHEEYPAYKAQRDKQPEDITMAIPFIKEVIEAYRIPVVEVPRYEADDVIGTLARRAEAAGDYTVYMMTSDKDYGQLVTDSVLMYRPASGGAPAEVRGPQQICERYGISTPAQVIDLLALEGDASDNIPGCPGVGEKTAVKLIAEWGSVDNLIAHVADLKGALQRRVADNVEQILFSRHLVTICTDVPIDIALDDLRRRDPDLDKLYDIYHRLEFKSMLPRDYAPAAQPAAPAPAAADTHSGGMASLFDALDEPDAADPTPATAATPAAAPLTRPEVSIIDDGEALRLFIARAVAADTVAVALWSCGDGEAMRDTLRGIAVALPSGETALLPLPQMQALVTDWVAAVKPLFAAGGPTVVCHNAKYAMVALSLLGIDFEALYHDTSVMHYLLSPEMPHDLPAVLYARYQYKTADYALSAAERRRQGPAEPAEAAALYGEAAAMTPALCADLAADLRREQLWQLYDEVERPLVAVLARIEREGMRIDVAHLHSLARTLTARIADLEQQAYQLAGMTFNISSPAQVGTVLFEHLKIDPKAKKTKRGAWSTAEAALEPYAAANPIVKVILDIRGLKKLLATYVEALPRAINPRTGKVHTTFNQIETATGRLSSLNPNLQNIPVRTDDGRLIRRAFIADPGCLIMSCDYSQIELRLMADISGDTEMISAFAAGEDIHRATAAKIFHKALADVTADERRAAKTANFGIIYGISAFGLSERLGISRAEAKALMDGYFSTYSRVHQYMQEAIDAARGKGYVTTIFGRKRYLPDINSRNAAIRGYAERNAINAPLQGSAADIIKMAMVAVDGEMRRLGLRSRMIMQVHDELVFNVVPDELDLLRSTVTRLMADAYHGRVPLEVAADVADNWLDAH